MRGSVGAGVSAAQIRLLLDRSFPLGPVLLLRLSVPRAGVQRRSTRSVRPTTSVMDGAWRQ